MNESYLRLPLAARSVLFFGCIVLFAAPGAFAQSKVQPDHGQGPGETVDGFKANMPLGTVASAPQPRFPVDTDYEPDEVLVMDPSEGLKGRAIALGFKVIENVMMENLSIRILRLSPPKGISVPEAIERLSRDFPDDDIDTNTLFDLNGGPN